MCISFCHHPVQTQFSTGNVYLKGLFIRYVLTELSQSRPKFILLIRPFTRYVWQSCLWIFPSKIYSLCLHNLNMQGDNFVISASICMLVIAAFYSINMNLSSSDGVNGDGQPHLFLSLSVENPQPHGQVFHWYRNPLMTCYFTICIVM